jgi:hypothetical protein
MKIRFTFLRQDPFGFKLDKPLKEHLLYKKTLMDYPISVLYVELKDEETNLVNKDFFMRQTFYFLRELQLLKGT